MEALERELDEQRVIRSWQTNFSVATLSVFRISCPALVQSISRQRLHVSLSSLGSARVIECPTDIPARHVFRSLLNMCRESRTRGS